MVPCLLEQAALVVVGPGLLQEREPMQQPTQVAVLVVETLLVALAVQVLL
jgi:hypothetical protein